MDSSDENLRVCDVSNERDGSPHASDNEPGKLQQYVEWKTAELEKEKRTSLGRSTTASSGEARGSPAQADDAGESSADEGTGTNGAGTARSMEVDSPDASNDEGEQVVPMTDAASHDSCTDSASEKPEAEVDGPSPDSSSAGGKC